MPTEYDQESLNGGHNGAIEAWLKAVNDKKEN